MFNVLLVEDDVNLRRLIHDFLKQQYYDVYACSHGEEALEVIETQHIDVVITDIMMPHMNGFELTKHLRVFDSHLPIIMITAKESWQDKKLGFTSGVDDYLVKPVNLDELSYRLKAILRRAKIATEHQIIIGAVTLNYQTFEVSREQEVISLPKKEFELLYKLLSYPKQIFTRQQLFDEIWGGEVESDLRTIDVHIKRLRDKVGHFNEFEIITVRGLGYKVERAD